MTRGDLCDMRSDKHNRRDNLHEVRAYRRMEAVFIEPCRCTLNTPIMAIIRIPVAVSRNCVPTPTTGQHRVCILIFSVYDTYKV